MKAQPADVEHFFKEARSPSGLTATCKSCRKEIRKAAKWPSDGRDVVAQRGASYRAANLDLVRARGRKRYHAAREENAAKALAYYHANKPAVRVYQRAKYRTRPDHRLRVAISNGMRRSLSGGKAGRAWESLVGYTLHELKRHLERQFSKGMTWENVGAWHIDHIIPLASFVITDCCCPDFRAAWALTNLRPLWAKENISKRDKRLLLL